MHITPTAATRHAIAATTNADLKLPVRSRRYPAPNAAIAPPIWWPANTHPYTSGPCSRPYACTHSAIVGGTVATQSRP